MKETWISVGHEQFIKAKICTIGELRTFGNSPFRIKLKVIPNVLILQQTIDRKF